MMKSILITLQILGLTCAAIYAQQDKNQTTPNEKLLLTPQQWVEDISSIIQLLEQHHPNPYRHITKERFYEMTDSIKAATPTMSDIEIISSMMQLVSTVRDGHTVLLPTEANGCNHWFPLSFYHFSDGIHVVSAHQHYKELVGAKVLQFGAHPAEVAFKRTMDLLSSDNDWGRLWNTFYLSNGEALKASQIIPDATVLNLKVLLSDGKTKAYTIKAHDIKFDMEHRFWGEMFPNSDRASVGQYVMAGGKNLLTYAQNGRNNIAANTDLPLHLKSRRAYWHEYLPKEKVMYMHISHVTDEGRGEFKSFREFYDLVFDEVEKSEVEKFVLDIRYNSGGDGSVLIPFVHKFIRCDKINQPGKLFTITGRKTFSAGVMLYDLMLKHTKTLLVGEPAGAPRSSYGDAGTYYLKHSGLQLDISSTYWQLTNSRDTSWYQPVDIPAVFSSVDYFSGKDPALDFIRSLNGPYLSLDEILVKHGGQVAKKEYEFRKTKWGHYDWWKAFEEASMRYAARDYFKTGKPEDGIAGFEILLDQYPSSWRAWRDLGDGLLNTGNKKRAADCYQRGLELNPGYDYFRQKIVELGKL